MQETIGSVGYHVDVPRAGLSFRGAVDSNWNVKESYQGLVQLRIIDSKGGKIVTIYSFISTHFTQIFLPFVKIIVLYLSKFLLLIRIYIYFKNSLIICYKLLIQRSLYLRGTQLALLV